MILSVEINVEDKILIEVFGCHLRIIRKHFTIHLKLSLSKQKIFSKNLQEFLCLTKMRELKCTPTPM